MITLWHVGYLDIMKVKFVNFKRMYSNKAGAGSYLLKQLECLAIEKGYRKAILSTRRVNSKAVTFYCRHAYSESSAYGKYVGVDRSICLSKILVT